MDAGKYLVSLGADQGIKADDGNTALSLEKEGNHTEIKRLLSDTDAVTEGDTAETMEPFTLNYKNPKVLLTDWLLAANAGN